jgi:outer membrane protein OmpA-like peptidoglycan-associated protein
MDLFDRYVANPLPLGKLGQELRSHAQKILASANVMLRHCALLLMLASITGCAGGLGQTFMVQFMPFSATPDAQGQPTVQAAIAFAKANPLMPVTIDGFHYGQYPDQFDSMGEERVRVVVSMLVDGGISRARIDILGRGIAYAQGSPMPPLPRDTVKIAVGL